MVDELQFSGKWDFSPAPESTDHISIKSEYQLFIDGKFVKPKKRKYFPTINPASEKKLSSSGLVAISFNEFMLIAVLPK